MDQPAHTPVLLNEVVEALAIRPFGWYVDCTVGLGGHSQAILEASQPDGRLLGLDADARSLELARQRLAAFGNRAVLVHANFRDLERVARDHGVDTANGIVMDLGLSSWQLADSARGFSFHDIGGLDMRFDPSEGASAADLVNTLPEDELAALIWRYGEEPKARPIARAIVRARPIATAGQLAEVIARAVRKRSRIHPATRTFQALRIAVNRELESLEAALPQAVRLLAPGGRLAVISFHSLEDRIVKTFFRNESRDCVCTPGIPQCICGHCATLRMVTKKPVAPSPREVSANPRARSAKLRVAERLPHTS
ncbi:MAG: 16S rRNA (cytosine(1402)-N(4))-methyltransferase RsmH [Anaerolineae bacterium]|nr:16S rRNA (cytosine(1402)-N(4))-methyltransferase RsmH [Anaerolineae bacterium]